MRQLLIAGSGKTARNIGRFFLSKGCSVVWVSRDAQRLAQLRAHLAGAANRIAREAKTSVGFHLYDDRAIPAPDVVIESINESLPEKQDVLLRLRRVTSEQTLVLSNSSSLLPDEIAPDCVGVHFFYPVELTEFAEVIWPDNCVTSIRERVLAFLEEYSVAPIEQTRGTAFAVNRLLLPLHAECFRLMADGWTPEEVDACSRSPLLPSGALTLIDFVGIDVIEASIRNYLRRMPDGIAPEYAVLAAGLGALVRQGRLGRKNGRGVICGAPAPNHEPKPHAESADEIRRRLLYVFINACYNSLSAGEMTPEALALALRSLFQSERSIEDVVRSEGREKIRSLLNTLHAQTALSYFRCEPGLKDGP